MFTYTDTYIQKNIALTRWTFVGKIMSLLFTRLSRLVINFLPRIKCLLISWLQSPSAVISRGLSLDGWRRKGKGEIGSDVYITVDKTGN